MTNKKVDYGALFRQLRELDNKRFELEELEYKVTDPEQKAWLQKEITRLKDEGDALWKKHKLPTAMNSEFS